MKNTETKIVIIPEGKDIMDFPKKVVGDTKEVLLNTKYQDADGHTNYYYAICSNCGKYDSDHGEWSFDETGKCKNEHLKLDAEQRAELFKDINFEELVRDINEHLQDHTGLNLDMELKSFELPGRQEDGKWNEQAHINLKSKDVANQQRPRMMKELWVTARNIWAWKKTKNVDPNQEITFGMSFSYSYTHFGSGRNGTDLADIEFSADGYVLEIKMKNGFSQCYRSRVERLRRLQAKASSKIKCCDHYSICPKCEEVK